MNVTIQRLLLKVVQRLPESWLPRLAGGEPIEIGGRTLDPMMQLLWVQGKRRRQMPEMTPAEAREMMREGLAFGDDAPAALQSSVRTAVPGPDDNSIPIRIDTPNGVSDKAPVFLYYHQGGCVIGDLETGRAFCSRLADIAKCIVAAVDYRLAPEHKFPASFDDSMAAYEWALENIAEHGGDPARIAVGGDSAGGMLSAAICQEAKRRSLQMPVLQVLVYPWLVPLADTESYETYADAYPLSKASMEWLASHYLPGEADRKNPVAAPGLAADLAGLPPALIHTAGFDPLRDEGHDYAKRLKDAGVEVKIRSHDSLAHGFLSFGGAIPAARKAAAEIAEEVREALG